MTAFELKKAKKPLEVEWKEIKDIFDEMTWVEKLNIRGDEVLIVRDMLDGGMEFFRSQDSLNISGPAVELLISS